MIVRGKTIRILFDGLTTAAHCLESGLVRLARRGTSALSKRRVEKSLVAVLFSVLIFPIVSFSSWGISSRANYAGVQQQGPTTDSASGQTYKERCAACHDRPKDRIPPRSKLRASPRKTLSER
jgi:hypothetical protein